jgi:hypothetical protein
MDIEGILAILLIFGGATVCLLAISPVGKAIAERIRGRSAALPDELHGEIEQLRSELQGDLQALRSEVGELGERVDFAERLLAKTREDQRLGPGQAGKVR